VSTTFPPQEPGRHGLAELLTLVGEIRRVVFLPSYVMTCDEQTARIRDLFLDCMRTTSGSGTSASALS
jgi:hypothetical protein